MDFKTGRLSSDQIELILNALPGDVTFVDSDDVVRYYNVPSPRLFGRDPSIIGKSVQACHPEKSVPLVDEILEDLRSGRKNVGQSWAHIGGHLVSVRYLALRGAGGEYLGCLEFAEDVSPVKEHIEAP
jgi:DUF438 domain-containing protein